MPLFGPPPHPAQKAPPEVNRYWRRLMWDNELTRLYSHLEQVTHSIDSHQKKLYLENTFHDQARDRANQLYADRISRENIGLFKRLMAVHTRKPKEFRTHQVQNPKTHSRFLEYQRVMEDNHRLVDRLLQSKTFVNDKGSWDEHALNHEQILLRLSHAPKNVFVPNLHAKRREEQRKAKHLSLSDQAKHRILQKPIPSHEQQAQHLKRVEQMVADTGIEIAKTWSGEVLHSPSNKKPLYHYPLPPNSIPEDPTNIQSVRATAQLSQPHAPPVLLPYGTHLVAPALVDEDQYTQIHDGIASNHYHNVQQISPNGRVYATTGALQDAMFTMPMPPPSPRKGEQSQAESVFYLRPHAHRARSKSPPRHQQHHHHAKAASAGDATQLVAQEAEPVPYPFPFPALESATGEVIEFASRDSMIQTPPQDSQYPPEHLPVEYDQPRAVRTAEGQTRYHHGHEADGTQTRATTSYAAAHPFTHATSQHHSHHQQQHQYQPHPPAHPHLSPNPLQSTASQKFLDYFEAQSTGLRANSARAGRRHHKPTSLPPVDLTASARSSLSSRLSASPQTSAYKHSTSARHQDTGKDRRRKTATEALEQMLDLLIQSPEPANKVASSSSSSDGQQQTRSARSSQTSTTTEKAAEEEQKTAELQPLAAVA